MTGRAMDSPTVGLEELLFHQRVFNSVEQRLKCWGEDMDGCDFDCDYLNTEFQNEDEDSSDQTFHMSQDAIRESLQLFTLIRSVISTNGTDKTLQSHFNVSLETFSKYLSSSCPDPSNEKFLDSSEFLLKLESFSFLLWLLCLPRSTCPSSSEDPSSYKSLCKIRPRHCYLILSNPATLHALLLCAETCLKFPSSSNSPQIESSTSIGIDSEDRQNINVHKCLFLTIEVLRCLYYLSSPTLFPKKACLRVLVRCISHDDHSVRHSASLLLGYRCQADFSLPETRNCLSTLTGVIRHELSDILASAAIPNDNQHQYKKLKNQKNRNLLTEEILSIATSKLTCQGGFFVGLLPLFPAESQSVILIDSLFSNFCDSSSGLCSQLSVVALNAISGYFRHFHSSDACSSDESWDVRRRLINALINHKISMLNINRICAQIKAVFNGLTNLIKWTDDFTGGTDPCPGDLPELRIGRRKDICDCFYRALNDPNSCLKMGLTMNDPTVQDTILSGWNRLLDSCVPDDTSGGVMLYGIIVKSLSPLLTSPFKSIWKLIFNLFRSTFDSVHNFALSFYSLSDSVLLSAFGSTLPDNISLDLSCLQSCSGFHSFYKAFSLCLLKPIFNDVLDRVLFVLHESEEPSPDAVTSDVPFPDHSLSFNMLKHKEASLYRSELRKVVGSAIRVFGVQSILSFPSLSLDRLTKVPMSSPLFAYESNSWVLLLLAECVGRDELKFFESYFLPLARELSTISQASGKGDIGQLTSHHYRRLIEQIWSILPAFMREPLDLGSVLNDGTLINAIIAGLDVPVIRDHVCNAIGSLSKQITSISDDVSNKSDFPYMNRIWSDISSANPDALKPHTSKLMGILIVRFLQSRRASPTISDSASGHSRLAQMLLDTIRLLTPLCDPVLLESNLNKFCSTWQVAVASAAKIVVSSECELNSTLSPTDYAALVDVVDALIPELPDGTVYRLFDVFTQLLQQCAEGLVNNEQMKKALPPRRRRSITQGNSTKYGFLVASQPKSLSPGETARMTLQCLIRRSFKGLKHILERIDKSMCSGVPHFEYTTITSEKIFELWKIVLNARNVCFSCTMKSRIGFLRSLVYLIASSSSNPDNSVLQKIFSDLTLEVLLGLQLGNQTVRSASLNLLQSMATSSIVSLDNLILSILPGLGSPDPSMKSASILALVSLLKSSGDLMSGELLGRLIGIAVTLLKDQNKLIFKSSLAFIRVMQRLLPVDMVPSVFQSYILPMLRSPHSLPCRVQIKHIIDKAIKKVGVKSLEPIFPESDRQLLYYVDRSLRRRRLYGQRLAAAEQEQKLREFDFDRKQGKASRHSTSALHRAKEIKNHDASDSEDDQLNSDDDPMTGDRSVVNRKKPTRSESTNDAAQNEAATVKALLDELQAESDEERKSGTRRNGRSSKRRLPPGSLTTYLVEGSEMDLLSSNQGASVTIRETASLKRPRFSESDNNAYKIGSDGRLIITEDDEDISRNKKSLHLNPSFGSTKKPDGLNPFQPSSLNGTAKSSTRTRKSLNDLKAKMDAVKSAKQVKKRVGHSIQKSGGADDLKRGSKLMPYTYIRLNPSMYKEKRRYDAIKSFKDNAKIGVKKPQKKAPRKGRK